MTQEVDSSHAFTEVSHMTSHSHRRREAPFISTQQIYGQYLNQANQPISSPLNEPLPKPRNGLPEIRKTGIIDLMGYYCVYNENCKQW